MKLPVGYTWEVGGQYLAQRQAFRELLQVLGDRVGARVRHPGRAVPRVQARRCSSSAPRRCRWPARFSRCIVTGTELNVSSAMGLMLLIGLVVKNGIVLLDYAERERERGVPAREAVYDAARVRLRPILMTTLCTLFGLFRSRSGLAPAPSCSVRWRWPSSAG